MQNNQHDFIDMLLSDSPISTDIHPAHHLKIYQRNVLSTLLAALMETYPLIKKLVGEAFFNVLGKSYIERYPSRHSHLQPYGEYFHEFLTEFEPVSHLIYLPEVAQFEWSCHQLFYAAEEAKLDAGKWQQFLPTQYEQIILTLHPACALKTFTFPILQIIALCKGETKNEVDLDQGGLHLLLHRPYLDIMLHPLTVGEWTFLTAIKEGGPLKISLDKALEKDAAFQLIEQLPRWIDQHLIVDAAILT